MSVLSVILIFYLVQEGAFTVTEVVEGCNVISKHLLALLLTGIPGVPYSLLIIKKFLYLYSLNSYLTE